MPLSQLTTHTLLSLGKHPLSGRTRRAEQDAKAFELAAKLGQCLGLHAGNYQDADALKSFAGMSIAPVCILEIEQSADPVAALSAYFKQTKSDIILTGSQAERGESSGMLPYLLGKSLDLPVINQVCEVEQTETGLNITQALPRGARRALSVKPPCILIIDESAPEARQTAYGAAMRAEVGKLQGYNETDTDAANFNFEDARKKPKRMKKIKAKTAADRFKAATVSQAKGGQVIEPKTSQEGAETILKLLKEEGLVKAN